MSHPDTKKKVVCMSRRRRPADVAPLSSCANDNNAESPRTSPSFEAHPSSVFVSPMSTMGRGPSFTQFSDRATLSPLSATAAPATRVNKTRPSGLAAVKSHDDSGWQDASELSLSTSASSMSVHRRPSLDASRRSSLAVEASPLTAGPSTAAANPASTSSGAARRASANISSVLCARRPALEEVPASPAQVSVGDRQVSYATLSSPPETALLSDLCVSREGVDWERVDADPGELFRQRNFLAAASVTRDHASKSLGGGSQDQTQNTAAPAPVSASWQASSLTATAPTVATSAAPATRETAVPQLERQQQQQQQQPKQQQQQQPRSSSFESSVPTESATCEVEDAIDVRVSEGETDGLEDEASAVHVQNGASLGATEMMTTPSQPGDVERKSGAATAAAAAAAADTEKEGKEKPKDGEVDIFVAVRVRPATLAGGAAGRPSAAAVGSCVRTDARRGLVDCSTIVPASVPGASAAAAATSAGTTAAATGTYDKVDTAAGKRTRTLRFFFDHLLDDHVAQREVMDRIGQRAVERVLAGYHGTVMCYGQSGSGKTYTIVGPNGGRLGKNALRWRTTTTSAATTAPVSPAASALSSPAAQNAPKASYPIKEQVRFSAEVGLLPRMLLALFNGLEAARRDSDTVHNAEAGGAAAAAEGSVDSLASWSVTLSALELYNEELRDLLPHSIAAKHKRRKPAAAGTAAAAATTDAPSAEDRSEKQVEATSPIAPKSKERVRRAQQQENGNKGGKAGKTRAKEAVSSPSNPNSALRSSFPSYPGLFSSTGKSSLEDTRCWDAEDLEVLNAVSSSDDDTASESGDLDDVDSNSSSNGSDSVNDESSPASASSPNTRENTVVLPSQPPDLSMDAEPDPSRPTTNDLGPLQDHESARGRLTIGMLTSVSPSPPRQQLQNVNGVAGKKQVVVTVDTRASAAASGGGGCGDGAETTTKNADGGNNGRPSAGSTRIPRRVQQTTNHVGKSPSPQPKPQARTTNASSPASPSSRTAARTLVATNTLNNGAGGQLVIRQGQRPASPTAALSHSFDPSSSASLKRSSRATSTKARSATRSRPGHRGGAAGAAAAAKNGDEAVYIDGLREHPIRDVHEAVRAVRLALHRRQMASTELNSDSSRAHTFFFVKVEQRRWRRRGGDDSGGSGEAATTKDGKPGKLAIDVRRSTLTLVDLAGSERVSHTGAHGLRLKEAQNINLSLSALGNVMRLLSAGATSAASTTTSSDAHIPYRDSKLTRILQSSLGGNAITFLLCNVSPDYRDASETMSTLRFAKLSKTVKNKARLNESTAVEDDSTAASAAVIARYQKEQRAALAAALAAETKMRAMAGDAATVRDRLQQMAAYTWWLEEQLGHFASRGPATSFPTLLTLPSSMAESGAIVTAVPPSSTGELRSGEVNSSVGPLSDTERATNGQTTDKLSSASCGECGPSSSGVGGAAAAAPSSWWRLSPRPASPPALSAVADTGGMEKESSGAAVYWQSDAARAFLAPTYSLQDRQSEMQRRLVIAAAAALAAAAAAARVDPSLGTSPQQHPVQMQQQSSARGPFTLISPTEPLPILLTSPPMSLRGSTRMSGEGLRYDFRQPATPSVSGVVVSESSIADTYSPNLSGFPDGAQQQQQQNQSLHSPVPHSPAMPRSGSFSSPLITSHSATQSAPFSLTRLYSQQHSSQPIPDFAVALAEERRARAAAQARVAAVERQNLLLRLRLAALQRQQPPLQQERVQQHGEVAGEVPDDANSLARLAAPAATTTTTDSAELPSLSSPPIAEIGRASLLTPPQQQQQQQQHLQWPPHSSRIATEASLEAFLARCGFVPLDPTLSTSAAAAAASMSAKSRAHMSAAMHTAAFTSGTSSPSDPHSLRSITVDPASLRALREGSAPRHDDSWPSDDDDDDREDTLLSDRTTVSSVLAVVNPGRNGNGAKAGGEEGWLGGASRGSGAVAHKRPSRALERDDAASSPQRARSPSWGKQLLDSVRNTLETVRAMSTQEDFYEPDDINTSVS